MLWLCCVETQLISFLGREESPAEWGVQILYHDLQMFIHKYFHTCVCELIGTILHHTLNFGGNFNLPIFHGPPNCQIKVVICCECGYSPLPPPLLDSPPLPPSLPLSTSALPPPFLPPPPPLPPPFLPPTPCSCWLPFREKEMHSSYYWNTGTEILTESTLTGVPYKKFHSLVHKREI